MSFTVEDENQPVTVVISQMVKLGYEQAYEKWIKVICSEAQTFNGHLGTSIIRPQRGTHPEYVIVFKFDHYVNLKKWMESDVRQQWLARSNQLVQDAPSVQQQSGMETWFVLPGKPLKSPPPRLQDGNPHMGCSLCSTQYPHLCLCSST
jgi:antibiotic biosynthesis monooxygenase (ABM) superfamily enzyme